MDASVDKFDTAGSVGSQDADDNGSQSLYVDRLNNLFDTCPNPEYENFETFARALYCKDCRMVLQPDSMDRVPCKVPKLVVRQDGTVIFAHVKCEKLDADEYCRRLVAESDDPVKTYWRAWSECHYLSCAVCRLSYPARDAVACQYHPKRPEYFRTNGSPKSAEQPIGRYPCCGQRAFRFEPVRNPFGCEYRVHVPDVKNKYQVALVEKTMNECRELIVVEPPPPMNFNKKIMKLVDPDSGTKKPINSHWWMKLTLGENRRTTNSSIICSLSNATFNKIKHKRFKTLIKKKNRNLQQTIHVDTTNSTDLIETDDDVRSMTTSDDSRVSKCLSEKVHWKNTRSSIMAMQDSQREYENYVFGRMNVLFNKSANEVDDTISCSSGTLDRPRDQYSALHANILAKIDAHNKTTLEKTTKTTTDKKKKRF